MTSQMREGTIRKCDMASIYTYQNTLYKLQMTGEQLRRFMEWSAAFFKTWKPDEVTIAFDPSVRYYCTMLLRVSTTSWTSPRSRATASRTSSGRTARP